MSVTAWKMNHSAAEQIQALCIPPHVIRETLEHPDHTYDTSSTHARRTPNGPRRFYCKGKVGVLVAVRDRTILAVFLPEGEDIYKEGGWVDY